MPVPAPAPAPAPVPVYLSAYENVPLCLCVYMSMCLCVYVPVCLYHTQAASAGKWEEKEEKNQEQAQEEVQRVGVWVRVEEAIPEVRSRWKRMR